jgi:hypothetical protein
MSDSFIFRDLGVPAPSLAQSRNHQVPRAPLPAAGVTDCGKASCTLSEGVTPPSSLVWTHATDQIPPSDFVVLIRPVCAGCCQPLLEDGPSRRYLRSLCEDAWTLTPSRSSDSDPFVCPSLPVGALSSLDIGRVLEPTNAARRVFSALQLRQRVYFGAAVIRSCSGSFTR